MTQTQDNPKQHNEETYEQLMSLIENTQGRLAPIIVGCDDLALRKQIVERYEAEARQLRIMPYRIILGQEPSVKAALEQLMNAEDYLQRGGEAVFTVTGAEWLLRVKLNPEDQQSDLDKFFGYLQWTREGLRQFRYPIVLWVSHQILRELPLRAADFWGWRKAVLRFISEEVPVISGVREVGLQLLEQPTEAPEFLPPLAELQAEIDQLLARDPQSASLATLYERLGQVYAQRIRQGEAENLEEERQQAIAAFQQAIDRYQIQNNQAAQVDTLKALGDFLSFQAYYADAINVYQQVLDISRQTGHLYVEEARALRSIGSIYSNLGQVLRAIDCYQQSLAIFSKLSEPNGEAYALLNLGHSYQDLGQYTEAIPKHQAALAIFRRTDEHYGEACVLNGLGMSYYHLNQYSHAIRYYHEALDIFRQCHHYECEANVLHNLGVVSCSQKQYEAAGDYYQQCLKIKRRIGRQQGEANVIRSIGFLFVSLEKYQQALDYYYEAIKIFREIGDRRNEAITLYRIAHPLAKFDRHFEALKHYQKAEQIYSELQLEHEVERCKNAIYQLNQIIAYQPKHAPKLNDGLNTTKPRRKRQQILWWSFILLGLGIALLIWWLAK